jgi:hypothetical protein
MMLFVGPYPKLSGEHFCPQMEFDCFNIKNGLNAITCLCYFQLIIFREVIEARTS